MMAPHSLGCSTTPGLHVYEICSLLCNINFCNLLEGVTVATPIDNVWKITNFKMSYLMNYICYAIKTLRGVLQ